MKSITASQGGPLSSALYRSTQGISEADLSGMVVIKEELPAELREFEQARDMTLDNETLAAQGFPGGTTEDIRASGRIAGYLGEFVASGEPYLLQPGSDVIAATVVHLFSDGGAVSSWMQERFLGEFRSFVGREIGGGEHLVSADTLHFDGFSDDAEGLRTTQTLNNGLVSSTIVDFRVGRLLGVAYVVSLGDEERVRLVSELGLALERRIVKVLLGTI